MFLRMPLSPMFAMLPMTGLKTDLIAFSLVEQLTIKETIAYARVGNTGVLTGIDARPEPAEWSHYCKSFLATQNRYFKRFLIVGRGKGPDGRQRGEMEEVMIGHTDKPAAVIDSGPFARGLINLFALIKRYNLKGVPDLQKARDLLDIPETEWKLIPPVIDQMEVSLGIVISARVATKYL